MVCVYMQALIVIEPRSRRFQGIESVRRLQSGSAAERTKTQNILGHLYCNPQGHGYLELVLHTPQI